MSMKKIPTIKKIPTKKTVANLEARDCRWPIGDPREAGFHFCGAPHIAGRPYCELHWRMSFQVRTDRQSAYARFPLKAA